MVGDLQHHNNDFHFDFTMKWWKEESDKIIIGETYEYFNRYSELVTCVVKKRVNWYSFEVMRNDGITSWVSIDRFHIFDLLN